MTRLLVVAAVLILAGAWVPTALADEAKAPISAAMLLNTLAPVAESRDAAFDRAMKEPGPPPPSGEGQISAVITVRNPCPPGTFHYEPPPRPGRFRK